MHGRTRSLLASVGGIAIAAVAVGCGSGEDSAAGGEGEPPGAAPPATSEPAGGAGDAESAATAQARQIFGTRCAVCHGQQGAGDGPGSMGLDPKPRDFRDAEWQDSVTDDHIAKIIKFGGAAVGKSPTMPGNPDLMAKPEVVQALVEHVRSLGGE